MLAVLLLAGVAAFTGAAGADAASVAYIDQHNLWLSSPDGKAKVQVTTGGTTERPWRTPSQGPDGKTVVVHRDDFEGSSRPVLYLYGPDAKFVTANVMPVYSGANIPVYPIGLDMDWNSQAVAYGYSYCGFACGSTYRGYWLTFSDNQGLYPTDPQGQSDFHFPTFYGKRVVSSDSGGRIFVQPDVPAAPFTNDYSGWLAVDGLFLSRVEVSSAPANLVAIEWSRSSDNSEGILVGRHRGTVPSDVNELCELPVNGASSNVTFSPDATQVAWEDADGVKVAGVPNLAAGTGTCTMSAPPVVISATGSQPSFGGANVSTGAGPAGPGAGGPGAGGPGAGGAGGGATKTIALKLAGKATRAAFRSGLHVRVTVPGAGRVDASASIPAKAARRLGLGGAKGSRVMAGAASARGLAAATSVVVARGRATAQRAGSLTVRLKPTTKARKAAKRMAGLKLTIRVSQGAVSRSATVKIRR